MKRLIFIYMFIFYVFLFSNFYYFNNNYSEDSFSRRIYSFNRGFDKSFFIPSLNIYIDIYPIFIINHLNNFISNIEKVQTTFFYFIIFDNNYFNKFLNQSILNFYFSGGFINFFKNDKLQNLDFKEFLYKKNYKKFNYLVMPLIGPSSNHFNLSLIISYILNPFFYFFDNMFVYYLLDILNKRSLVIYDSNFFHKEFFDGYIFLKDIYIQNNINDYNRYDDIYLNEPPD